MNRLKSLIAPFRAIHKNYVTISTNKPYLTAMATGGFILSISDATAQYLSSQFIENYQYDLRRTLALCAFGTFYYGLIARKIYFIYEWGLGPGRPILKAGIDCAIHTPFLLLPCFYFITGLIKGQSVNGVALQLKDEWWTSSTASLAYWFPMMWFNFSYCTPQTRIFFIATMSWIHKSALSWYSNRNRVAQRIQMQQQQEQAQQPQQQQEQQPATLQLVSG